VKLLWNTFKEEKKKKEKIKEKEMKYWKKGLKKLKK
jgi:hypothetical protein